MLCMLLRVEPGASGPQRVVIGEPKGSIGRFHYTSVFVLRHKLLEKRDKQRGDVTDEREEQADYLLVPLSQMFTLTWRHLGFPHVAAAFINGPWSWDLTTHHSH